jgi:protein OS-9
MPASSLKVDFANKRVTQRFVSGQVCDLTGRPRTVEIQYRCNPKAGALNYMEQLQEPATCEYLVVIVTPLVCILSGMKEDSKLAPTIVCQEKKA